MRFIITLITSLLLLIPASGQGEWKIVDLGIEIFPSAGLYTGNQVRDVQFIDRYKGFICTGRCGFHLSEGVLFKTEDGGKTWIRIFEDASFVSIHFLDESKGFLTVDDKCYVEFKYLTSTDGGYSWVREDDTHTTESNFFFLNDSTGWNFGERIFKTINGGGIWSEEYGSKNYCINSLYFVDDSTGWAVGEQGLIMKYTIDDGWKKLSAQTGFPLKQVFFVDQDNGWISGGYGNTYGYYPNFFRTEDGGRSWTPVLSLNILINDFYFENMYHGWAIGEYTEKRGAILETFNRGSEWEVVVDSLPARLNALHIGDGIGWAVGDDGLILTNDLTLTGDSIVIISRIKENNKLKSLITNLFLQNYPNPFSSNTTITYQLLSSSDVELSIYDISGRKIIVFVNERQQPDRYEVEWNAEGMNPGIYFCELKTGQGRQVMKMSIVK